MSQEYEEIKLDDNKSKSKPTYQNEDKKVSFSKQVKKRSYEQANKTSFQRQVSDSSEPANKKQKLQSFQRHEPEHEVQPYSFQSNRSGKHGNESSLAVTTALDSKLDEIKLMIRSMKNEVSEMNKKFTTMEVVYKEQGKEFESVKKELARLSKSINAPIELEELENANTNKIRSAQGFPKDSEFKMSSLNDHDNSVKKKPIRSEEDIDEDSSDEEDRDASRQNQNQNDQQQQVSNNDQMNDKPKTKRRDLENFDESMAYEDEKSNNSNSNDSDSDDDERDDYRGRSNNGYYSGNGYRNNYRQSYYPNYGYGNNRGNYYPRRYY